MPSQSPPRVSCFSLPPFGIQSAGTTLNPLFFLGHGATAMMLFNALGGHHLLKVGARYARSTAHSLSFFFTGLGTSANFVFISYFNGICAVDFRKIVDLENNVLQSVHDLPLAELAGLFYAVAGCPAPAQS